MEIEEEDTPRTIKHKTKEEMKLENLAHTTQELGDVSPRKEVNKVIENSVGYLASKFEDIPTSNNKRAKEDNLAHSLSCAAKMEVIDA